jgi:hypothetical protein
VRVPRFQMFISGESLERALTELNDAGIVTLGPSFTPGEGSDAPKFHRLMIALVHAPTATEAEGRVNDILWPEGVRYTIEGVMPVEPSGS